MAKNNIKRRHSKTLDLSSVKRYRPLARNIYEDGGGASWIFGDYNGSDKGLGWGQASGNAVKNSFSTVGNAVSSVGAIAGGVTGIVDSALKNAQIADTTGIENEISNVKNSNFTGAQDTTSLLDSWNSMNWADSDHTQQSLRGVSTGEMIGNTISAIGSGASAGAQIGGPWGAVAGAAVGLGGSLAGIFVGNKKAREKAEELNRAAEAANIQATNNFAFAADKMDTQNKRNMLANIIAKGGPLKTPYASPLDYDEIDFGEGEPFTIPSGYSYLTIPGTNRLKMRAALSTGESPYLDSWNEARYSTGRFNDQLGNGNMELQRNNRGSAVFSYTPDKSLEIDPIRGEAAEGYFNPVTGRGWVGNRYNERPTLDLHEKAHSSRAVPQENTIKEILGDRYTDGYYDDPSEVYSRLMEIRQAYDLNPLKTYDEDDVKDLKKRGFQNNFLDRYDTDTLIRLFNDVANNDSMDYTNYAKDGGKIHIKPSKRGTFTAAAKKHGKSVQAFASQVLAHKENYSPAMVKKANFARNASKWKHSLGGFLYGEGGNLYADIPNSQTHGTDFSNGMTLINRGGTHEQNPFEGVQMGVDPQGIPNLVEEGEVVFNDYVFSNRLHPSEKELRDANLPKRYKDSTFAFIAEDMGKESSERPNDPISRRGLEDSMMKLAMVQEAQRAKKGKKGTQQLMAYGGRKYDGRQNIFNSPLKSVRGVVEDYFPKRSIDIPNILAINYSYPSSSKKTQAPQLSSIPLLSDTDLDNIIAEADRTTRDISDSNPINVGNTKLHADTVSTPLPTWMRYAPAVGSAIGAIQSIFQKPDYENADILMEEARNLSRPSVRYRALNNYMTYRPLDRNYYLNQLKSQAGATRRGIMNSGSNAGNVMAGLLAADYNAQNAVGNTLMQMEQYNDAQRQRVAEFNRGTDQYNSQAAMSADAQNAQIAQNRDRLRSSLMSQAAQMREASDAALEATRSGNLTNFFDNMGGIGQDNMNQNWRNRLIDVGYFGAGADRVVRKNGGKMLTKRNRRRK